MVDTFRLKTPFVNMFWGFALVFWTFGLLKLVKSDDVIELKRDIASMEEHTKALKIQNQQLEGQLQAAKRKCEETLAPLRQKQEQLFAKQTEALAQLEEVIRNTTQLEQEEKMLVKLLNIEVVMEMKYRQKILLYTQEIELYTMRRQNGQAQKCQKLKPLFNKHGAAGIGTRSMGGIRQQKSPRDYLIVLQNSVNHVKILVKAEQDKNQRLRNEIEKQEKLCMNTVRSLQEQLAMNEEALKESLDNLDLSKLELAEMIKTVEELTIDLKARQELNAKIKADSQQLKNNLQAFSEDVQCYTTISEWKVKDASN